MNIIDLQTGRYRSKFTSIPEIVPLPQPYLKLQVPAGYMPRSLHFGVALVNVLYNSGSVVTLKFKRSGGNVGEMRFRMAQKDDTALYEFNVMPPCVTYQNRIEDGSPDDIAAMHNIGALPPDSLRWDWITETGEDGVTITSPIHFVGDIDEIEMVPNDALWGTNIVADNNTVTGLYGYAYFFLGVISNPLK